MKLFRVLTAVAVSTVLSTAAFAHGHSSIGSGGSAEGGAFGQGAGVIVASTQKVDTRTSSGFLGSTTSTKASSDSFGAAKWGVVAVGGEASAGSGASSGH